jgi:hypothetical protein
VIAGPGWHARSDSIAHAVEYRIKVLRRDFGRGDPGIFKAVEEPKLHCGPRDIVDQ